MRLKKQIAILVVLLVVFVAVIWLLFVRGSSNHADDTEDMALSEDDTEESQTGGFSRQYLLENYGTPDESESFAEVHFEDGMENQLDFDQIAGLRIYRAQPCYLENELIEELIVCFGLDKDSYSISKRDYSAMTEGDVVGWGNYYSYTDESGNIVLSGSSIRTNFSAGSVIIQVDSEEQEQFLTNLVEEYHLGIWEEDLNLLQPFTSSASDGTEYIANLEIDGIEVTDVNANINVSDADGARYSAIGYSDLRAVFDEEGVLEHISEMLAADITESSELKYTYNNLDDITEVVNLSLNTGTSGVSSVYLLEHAELVYACGICEDGTFLLTPWLVFEGQEGYYYPNEGRWFVSDCEIYLNLNTGDAYAN